MLKLPSYTVIILCILSTMLFSQRRVEKDSLSSDYVTKSSRDKFTADLEQKIVSTFSKPLNQDTERAWKSLFREIELANYKNSSVHSAAGRAIEYAARSNPSFQRAAIELIYTLYPDDYFDGVYTISNSTRNAQVFATASIYLMNHSRSPVSKDKLRQTLHFNFPGYKNDPVLRFLDLELSPDPDTSINDTLLTELLTHPFQKGKTVIYSLHRKDRRFSGLTIIKKPDGKFVRNPDSTIFSVAQLAHSTSRLPGYISQGDTPQGIFSVVGFYVSPTESIGPTPNVLTRIPFEVSTEIFYHNEVTTSGWAKQDYKDLLPLSWQDYPWIYESYYAGKAGRKLIVMHGSTDDISFFRDKIYYPLTPSKGCLTTKEIWSEETGRIIESDQVKLMNAFFSTGQLYGFLVVLNLDDSNKPVTIEELLPLIEAAEKQAG